MPKTRAISESVTREAVHRLRAALRKSGRADLAESLLIKSKRGYLYVAEGHFTFTRVAPGRVWLEEMLGARTVGPDRGARGDQSPLPGGLDDLRDREQCGQDVAARRSLERVPEVTASKAKGGRRKGGVLDRLKTGAFDEYAVRGGEDVLIVERIKEILLG